MRILKGTRQGGMSSPFLFNLFCQDMIDILNNMNCGISINDNNYNVCCYADDVLLTSVTSTGLQLPIDTANSYITSHGLRFNPDKTKCTVFGKQMLMTKPKWILNNTVLDHVDSLEYLGVVISNNTECHVDSRIRSCRRAFYSLQGSGMHQRGVSPDTTYGSYMVGSH